MKIIRGLSLVFSLIVQRWCVSEPVTVGEREKSECFQRLMINLSFLKSSSRLYCAGNNAEGTDGKLDYINLMYFILTFQPLLS